MDDRNRDPRPRKRFRSSPQPVQYQYPRQHPASDTGSPGLSTNLDQGTSLLLPSDTATGSDGLATRTRTNTRTHSSSQDWTSDAASPTVDSGSSSTEAVSDSGGVTGTASDPTGSSAADVRTSTGAANSMSAHPTTNHQQPTVNAVPSSLSPTSTSAYTSVLITTTATINGHLTTFATLVPTTLSSFPHDSSQPLKPPSVAAAVVGTLFATALLAGLGFLFVRRRKQRKAKTALNAARKNSMRRGRRVLDDDDGDDEDGLPMRYAGSGSAGSHSHSMSTSYQYGVVGSLPPGSPTRGDSIPSSSSFGYSRSQDAFSFQHIGMNEFAGKDPAEVRRLRAGRTGSSSGSIFREDFNSESLGGARLITTNGSTPRPSSMASSPNSPSPTGTPTPTSNPFDSGYFPHKRSSTASSSALGLLEAIGGVMPSASLEVVNMSRSASPESVQEGTQLPYHQPKRSSVTSIRTHALPSPKSTLPLTATTTTAVATPSRAPSLTSPAGAFHYPPKSRSPPIPLAPVSGPTPNTTTTRTRSPQPFPVPTSSTSPRPSTSPRRSTSPRSSTYGPYIPGSRNSLGPGSLPPGAASPPGPLARTSIIVDEQFGVSASNAGLPPTDYHYKMPPNRRRSSSGGTSISQAMQSSPQPHFNPSDLVPGRERQKRRDSFVLPDVPVSGTGSLRDKDRGSTVDIRPYLSEDEDDGVKSGIGDGGIEKRKPRPSFSS